MVKKDVYTKKGVGLHEYNMTNYIYNLKLLNVPKIISYDKNKKVMRMEKINGLNLSDEYGETIDLVPSNIISQVRLIIQTLKLNNIIYPDITGYNFIYSDDKVWIIDFEHAYFNFQNPNEYYPDTFVDDFINGENDWNPDFK